MHTPEAGLGSDIETLDYNDIGSEKLIDIAASLGCDIYYPSDYQLTIDLDSEKEYKFFVDQFHRLKLPLALRGFEVTQRKSPCDCDYR